MTLEAPSPDAVPAAKDLAAPRDAGAVPQPTAEPNATHPALPAEAALPVEVGGRQGPEPTRYGDWEMRGRCIDF